MSSISNEDLSHLVVLETGCSVAAAFCTVLLADFGATVLACENPPHGSSIRALGGSAVQEVWWKVIARNKRSIAIDGDNVFSRPVIARLCNMADVVLIDAGSPKYWIEEAQKAKNSPLLVSISSTGADLPNLWPWSVRPEFAAAATGMMALTGQRDGEPVQPEFPLSEYLSGMMTATHILAELRRRRLTRLNSKPIVVAEHEAGQRMIEWQIPVATALGRPELRDGNNFSMAGGISYIHQTSDGRYVATSAATQSVALRLMNMVGGERLCADPRFANPATRSNHMPALIEIIDNWISQHSFDDVIAAADLHDVVVGPIYNAEDVLRDSHLRARDNFIVLRDGDDRAITMPAVLPRISGIDTNVVHLGPAVGAQTNEVLARVGFSDDEIRVLHSSNVVWG